METVIPARQIPAPQQSLLPREHGASIQLVLALLTAFCLARPTGAALALGASAVLVFIAHESFMVLIGRRGARRRTAQRTEAWRTLLALGVAAAALLALAVPGLSPSALAALLLPIALGTPAVLLALRGHERSLFAELLVAFALISVSVPVALASDAPLGSVLTVSAIWLVFFTVGTLAARGVLYRAKDAGRGLKLARAVAVIVAVLSLGAAVLGWLSVGHALAPLPSVILALIVATRPPSPKQMTKLGLGLTAASLVSFALLVT